MFVYFKLVVCKLYFLDRSDICVIMILLVLLSSLFHL